MRPNSPTAEALARRLIDARAPKPGESGGSPLAATERALLDVADALARWFGPFGYHALLARACTQARRDHAALADVTVGEAHAPALAGLEAATAEHGVEAVAAGAEAVLTAVIALLGRVVGDDMVLYLVEPRMNVNAPAPAIPAPSDTRASPGADGEPAAGADRRTR